MLFPMLTIEALGTIASTKNSMAPMLSQPMVFTPKDDPMQLIKHNSSHSWNKKNNFNVQTNFVYIVNN